ncbi:MAG: hypothetical protein AAB597_02330 [Patescibacteria group bacterium]
MPLIKLEFDDKKVPPAEIQKLLEAVQKIVSEITEIQDVFVYANSSQIKIQVAPIEIFVEMSAHKIKDADALINDIKVCISKWKQKNGFEYPINLTLIPMQWKIEIGI